MEDKTSTGQTGIMEALSLMHKNFGIILKEGDNDEQGFKFHRIDDVVDRMHKLLNVYDCMIVPNILESKATFKDKANGKFYMFHEVKVEYEFLSFKDGSNKMVVSCGTGLDHTGDKAYRKAMSQAYKSLMLQMFSIPLFEEDGDGHTYDADGIDPKARNEKRSEPSKQKTQVISKTEADEIKELLDDIKGTYTKEMVFKGWNNNEGYKAARGGRMIKKVENIPAQIASEIKMKLKKIKKNMEEKDEKK